MSDEIEYRQAATLEVRHPERVIELIAVPYDEECDVMVRGRWITETVAPGAFAGVAGDIRVNRSHDEDQPIGKVVKLHPNDGRGLRTEIRISNTAAGNDVLELAADDLLGASVGFMPLEERYAPDRSKRRIVRAVLRHIAMVGNPAYAGAKVLAVRSADPPSAERAIILPPTPNLDEVRSWLTANCGSIVAGVDATSRR